MEHPNQAPAVRTCHCHSVDTLFWENCDSWDGFLGLPWFATVISPWEDRDDCSGFGCVWLVNDKHLWDYTQWDVVAEKAVNWWTMMINH